jgi:hypothetical protein
MSRVERFYDLSNQKKGRRSARKVLGEWWVSPRGDTVGITGQGKHNVNFGLAFGWGWTL